MCVVNFRAPGKGPAFDMQPSQSGSYGVPEFDFLRLPQGGDGSGGLAVLVRAEEQSVTRGDVWLLFLLHAWGEVVGVWA